MSSENKLGISSQFLHCPLLISIDTYEGCLNECRYCFTRLQYRRQNKGKPRPEPIRPALLASWERVLNGESIRNPMIEYLVKKKHPVQLGTKADPFPKEVEKEQQNTRKFVELCNQFNYPIYITTKNPDVKDMPIDLLAKGNYVLGVSLASHKAEHIKMLERNTSKPSERIDQIPTGLFKKSLSSGIPLSRSCLEQMEGKAKTSMGGKLTASWMKFQGLPMLWRFHSLMPPRCGTNDYWKKLARMISPNWRS